MSKKHKQEAIEPGGAAPPVYVDAASVPEGADAIGPVIEVRPMTPEEAIQRLAVPIEVAGEPAELTFRVRQDAPPSWPVMQLHGCMVATFIDETGIARFALADILPIADVLQQFVLQHRDAPAAAMLMQIKLKTGLLFLPNHDPRKVELALDLFRRVVLGLNDIQRADDEAELRRLEAERVAAAPAPKLREEERTMRAAGGGLGEISDFGKAMSGQID